MNKKLMLMACALAGAWCCASAISWAGYRVGGNADLVYESINAGGASFSSNGPVKLGGSLGQNGFTLVATNTQLALLHGFWKAEDACVLYSPLITGSVVGGGAVGLSFLVVNSNTYTVLSVDQEAGGLMAGSHSFTSVVASFEGRGPAGSSTSIWQNTSAATNRAKFYLIRCEP